MSAPAQRISEHYVWSPDAGPISIHLSLDVVQKLHPPAPGPESRTPEIGGVLVGWTRQRDDLTLVSIEDCVLVDCEYARSASWSLSARDRYVLESTLRQLGRRKKGSPTVIGWFRTHTRRGLYLDEYDFNLFREYFSGPACVALLIRPDQPVPTAAFFFWEGGELQRSQPHGTFPFSVEALRSRSVASDAAARLAPASRPLVRPIARPVLQGPVQLVSPHLTEWIPRHFVLSCLLCHG